MFKPQLSLKGATAFAAALILTTTSAAVARAQHEQHGGHSTPPAQSRSKPKKKQPTKKKARSAKGRTRGQRLAQPSQSPRPAVPQQQPKHAAPTGQDVHKHGAQPSPTPQPTPAQEHHTQAAPAEQETPKHDQHGAQPSPTPQPAPTPGGHTHTPPATQETHKHGAEQPAAPKEQAEPVKPAKAAPAADKGAMDHSSHGSMSHDEEDELSGMSGNLFGIRVGDGESNVIPMGQMGSGTAWQPATTPMYMWPHKRVGEWLLMLHGEAKIGVNRQGGPRGVTKFESQNWLMPMAFRRVGRGTLQLRGMFSLEPLTFSGAGSPQLFQTGEVYKGQPIRDAQHPHDLFMELSAQYTVAVGERATWYAYFGFPGEPALGPVAFMHRMSASENPTAPLSHHLQDSTHISFGVFTTGFTYRWLKIEGSMFNGREPDDKRYGFEFNPWNSRSVRVSVAPNENWALQYSYGLLKNPEFFAPGDTHRQTASVQYNRPFERGNWATALVWGRNREEHGGETFRLNSYLLESTLNFLDKNYLYTRVELVDREGDDLLSHDELHELGFGEGVHPQFRVGAYTFGAARDLWNTDKLSVALGGDLTVYTKPSVLDPVYGRNPASYKLFLRIRPGKMNH